MVVKSVS